MAISPPPGTVIGGYKIVRMLNKGMLADSFHALDQKSGRAVFLKAYHSPGPYSEWYGAYLQYVRELNARIASTSVHGFCVTATSSFACNPDPDICDEEFFYQTYDFIADGQDLAQLLGKEPQDLRKLGWKQRVQLAKEFVHSMAMLHRAGIVHCDLKPDNIMLLPGKGPEGIRWTPRLIDMDRSILTDRTAPWHGLESYVGTPGYKSPEHLRGEVPTVASDVFTTGIILCELLAGTHPYDWLHINEQEYNRRVLTGNHLFTHHQPKPLGPFGTEAGELAFAGIITACLSPAPEDRPTDADLLSAMERMAEQTSNHFLVNARLFLAGDIGREEICINGPYGAAFMERITREAMFCSYDQFRFKKEGDGWHVYPEPKAMHLSVCDGAVIPAEGARLRNGSELCVESRISHNRAMKITVELISTAAGG